MGELLDPQDRGISENTSDVQMLPQKKTVMIRAINENAIFPQEANFTGAQEGQVPRRRRFLRKQD